MNSLDEYLAFCSCSERVTGITVSIMDMENLEFVNDAFCKIHKSNPFCRSYGPHIYGLNLVLNGKTEASCIYHCQRGLSFFCVPISSKYVLIAGPAVLSERQAEAQEYGNTLGKLPVVSEKKMRDIETWFRLAAGVEGTKVVIADQSGLMTEGVFVPAYSIDTLRELFAKIREGDYAGAQPLLDQLTDPIIENLDGDFEAYGFRAWEDLIDQLEVMRVKKALSNTKILCVGRFGTSMTPSAGDTLIDPNVATEKLGVHFVYANIHEFIDQTHVGESEQNKTLPGHLRYPPYQRRALYFLHEPLPAQ